jgi:hypothetical protein
MYITLGTLRSALKKDARLIVEKQYGFLNIDGEPDDNWAEQVALKVQGLLDEAGPSNMAFTDGPRDHNVSQFFFPFIRRLNSESSGKPRALESSMLPRNHIKIPLSKSDFTRPQINSKVWPTTYNRISSIWPHNGKFRFCHFTMITTHYMLLSLGLYLSGRMDNRNTGKQRSECY